MASEIDYSSIDIDGGILEGGGQILRIAISLAGIFRRPLHVFNIRGNRPKPGLMAQHLTGLQLARNITGGELYGDKIGSCEIRYKPAKRSDLSVIEYFADTRTAGSITLLLQATLPILVYGTDKQSKLRLRGGTNVSMSPQVDFTTLVLKPLLHEFGIDFNICVPTRGYFPKGGGEVIASVEPKPNGPLPPIILMNRGDIVRIDGYSFVGGRLPFSIAKEMSDQASLLLRSRLSSTVSINIQSVHEKIVGNNGNGSGIVLIATTTTGCKISGSALGSRDSTATQIGSEAAEALLKELEIGTAVDCYIQDQLIIFMALASGLSSILAGPITLHTQTAIYVVEKILPQVKFTIKTTKSKITDTELNIIECNGIGYC